MKWTLGLHGGSSYESIASIVALDFLHNYGVGMRRVPQTDLKLIFGTYFGFYLILISHLLCPCLPATRHIASGTHG